MDPIDASGLRPAGSSLQSQACSTCRRSLWPPVVVGRSSWPSATSSYPLAWTSCAQSQPPLALISQVLEVLVRKMAVICKFAFNGSVNRTFLQTSHPAKLNICVLICYPRGVSQKNVSFGLLAGKNTHHIFFLGHSRIPNCAFFDGERLLRFCLVWLG